MSDIDDEYYERPSGNNTKNSKNIWGRITRSTSQDDYSMAAQKSSGFFRKRVPSADRGDIAALAPVNGTRKKWRNDKGKSRAASDTEGKTKRKTFQRRHTATLGSETVAKKSIFSLGRKSKKQKARRESGCKSDGDSVDMGSDDCSSIDHNVHLSTTTKRVGFRQNGNENDRTKPISKFGNENTRYSTANRQLPSTRRLSDGSNDAFFEANSFSPNNSFSNLPQISIPATITTASAPAPAPAQPMTIDSRPLFKPSVSFDSAPAAPGCLDKSQYGYDDFGINDKATTVSTTANSSLAPSDHHAQTTLDAASRPRSASDYGTHPPVNTTRRTRARYNGYEANSGIKKKYRVRPYHCFPDGTQMTEEEIYADSMNASQTFVHVQSSLAPSSSSTKSIPVPEAIRAKWGSPNEDGRIGSLRVEILGCIGLSRTKPDVSAYVICGDGAFCTDVLTGYRSPMWPCVARRACVFPIHHAYAKLYVGVFDCRVRKVKENDFFCGRVSIDIGSLRPNTEYDTTMPLRASTFVYDKRKRGVIRLRMSLHWFDESSAILSYFSPVKSLVETAPLLEGQPTIPCADPKTFRNVAITIYGQDLPGKYSRSAFKATIREFNLYQQNLRHFVKTFFLNIMLYERPVLSLYCLAASIYCVTFNSVRMVPAFFVGFIIIVLMRSYLFFVEDSGYHLGYKPASIREVFMALASKRLLRESKNQQHFIEPLTVEKKTKKRRGQSRGLARLNSRDENETHNLPTDDPEEHMKLVDHREFPFSDRDAYPKFAVEEALANSGTMMT